jgi:hypothetical protein
MQFVIKNYMHSTMSYIVYTNYKYLFETNAGEAVNQNIITS